MPFTDKFVPYDEDADVVESLLDVPLDTDAGEDGDDSTVAKAAPGPLRRLLERLSVRG